MRIRELLAAATFALGCAHQQAHAQDLDNEAAALASRLGRALVSAGIRTAVALDFTDLQTRPTELGRYLAERVSIDLVAVRGLTMVDRANIRNILAEYRLSEEGLVNPASVRKLGEFAGVDALITGTVTVLGDRINVTVKAIATSTAQIAAASQASITMTPDLRQLQYSAVSRRDEPSTASRSTSPSVRDETDAPIASRDVGPIRVLLRSISPVDAGGVRGLRISLDILSREVSRELVLAVNGEPGPTPPDGFPRLRASAADQRGTTWALSAAGLQGIGHVWGGVKGPRGEERYQPGDIASLLALRDRIGRETDSPDDVSPYQCSAAGCNTTWGVPAVKYQNRNRFVSGSTTSLAAGEAVRVTLDLVGPAASRTEPQVLQLSVELIVGTVDQASGTSYRVRTLSFDRLRMSVP